MPGVQKCNGDIVEVSRENFESPAVSGVQNFDKKNSGSVISSLKMSPKKIEEVRKVVKTTSHSSNDVVEETSPRQHGDKVNEKAVTSLSHCDNQRSFKCEKKSRNSKLN